MRRSIIFGLIAVLFAILLTPSLALPRIQGRGLAQQTCNPFTRVGQAGMLALGTVVDIVNYEAGGPVTRTGTVDEYYITTNCPAAAIFFMDAQAYVIRYGAADGSRRIVSLREMTVR